MNKTIKTIGAAALVVGTLLSGFSQIGQTNASSIAHTQQMNMQQQNHQKFIKQTKQLAAEGKVINSESFALGSKSKDIVKKWGKPDEGSEGDFLYYDKRQISFFGESGHVTQINSHDKRYDDITYKEVKKVLGNPVEEERGEDGIYLTYKAGKHILEITFYYNNAGTAPDTIKELSVL